MPKLSECSFSISLSKQYKNKSLNMNSNSRGSQKPNRINTFKHNLKKVNYGIIAISIITFTLLIICSSYSNY